MKFSAAVRRRYLTFAFSIDDVRGITSIHLQTSRAWREPLVPVFAHRNICVIHTVVRSSSMIELVIWC
jgi:hypothetical protein